VPSLCDYHYRVKQLDDELLKSILEECANLLLEDKQILCYIADATGFGFGDKYNLNWKRGTQIRTVQSPEGGFGKKSTHCLCYSLELLGACNLLIFVISVWYLAI
jgi:hypothetical protein